MEYAKKLGIRDLDLPERRHSYTSSREEEEEDRQSCPCGKARESRIHIVTECELTGHARGGNAGSKGMWHKIV